MLLRDDLRRHENIWYTPSFMMIGAGIQAVWRFGLRNLRTLNVGITDDVHH
jgi:hypothetical protein